MPIFFFDRVLDRQPVAVPARHVGRVEAGEDLRLDDDVLEDLVDRVADVDVAVGVGRPVVQDVLRPAPAGGAQFSVQVHFLPALQDFRLALREAGLHRKIRLRQVQGFLVVGHKNLIESLTKSI